jgi:hypothetical protein
MLRTREVQGLNFSAEVGCLGRDFFFGGGGGDGFPRVSLG